MCHTPVDWERHGCDRLWNLLLPVPSAAAGSTEAVEVVAAAPGLHGSDWEPDWAA